LKILLISLIFTINILALDFNMIPENFHATNIKVSLGLASSIARSKSKIISFTNNKFILDYSDEKYEVKKFNLGFKSATVL